MLLRHGILHSVIAAFALAWTTAALADDTIYFVQHSFYAEKSKHITTNYHVGTLVPINTKVKITDMGSSKMKIELPDQGNTEIKIENAEKHTKKSMEEIKNRMFGTNEVDLKKSSKEVQESIKTGQIAVGMTKDEVLLAYGYPPAHATASTDADQWIYWKTRWNKVALEFKEGKLQSVRD